MTPHLTPQIPHPTFPLQVQKIVMDFLKENKDGGKVRGPTKPRRVCVARRTLTPLTPSALPYMRLYRW